MDDKKSTDLVSRRGFAKYRENPSIAAAAATSKTGVRRMQGHTKDRFMIVSQEGEIVAPAGFHEIVEVDKTKFVKLYVDGVKAFQGLTAAGAKVFELVYRIAQGHPGTDRFYLHFMTAEEREMQMSKRTFHRGMRELLEREFIYEAVEPNLYFLNVAFLFNGNRLAFIKEYRLRSADDAIERGKAKIGHESLLIDQQN